MKTLNIKTLVIVLIAATLGISSSYANDNKRGPFLTNGFWDNWYLSVGAGAQSYIGVKPSIDNLTIIDRATIAYSVSLGKWITPSFGVRAQGVYSPAVSRFGDNHKSMSVINVHADAMFNLSHMFGGYKDHRFYQAIIYAGAGIGNNNFAEKHSATAVTGNVGLINKFRIAKKWDINIELGGVAYPRAFDGIGSSGNIPFDAQLVALGGITYRFGNKEFDNQVKAAPKVDLSTYNNRIKELEGLVSSASDEANRLQRRIKDLEARTPEVKVEKQVLDLAGSSTFFNIGSSKLGARDMVNIEELAKFINQTPDVKYTLTGMIDYTTGSRQLNDKLCADRVNSVFNALKGFGVKESQLVKSTKAPISPSKNPILNRGVIISTTK